MRNVLLTSGLVLVAGSAMAEETPSFNLTAVQVESSALPALKELDPVGKGNQPTWTTAPRFSFSEVYTLPEGVRQARVDMLADTGFGGSKKASHIGTDSGRQARPELTETLAAGLGNGWQVGVSFVQDAYRSQLFDEMDYGGKLEIRKSIAPWGEIWGNPTVLASYAKREEGMDTLKVGVLLGDNITDQWSWVSNVNYVRNFDWIRDNKGQWTSGVMYSVVDNTLAVGLEADVEYNNARFVNTKGVTDEDNGLFIGFGPSASLRTTVAGNALTVHGSVLLLSGTYRESATISHPRISLGVSYNF